ncbi:MAG: hypothetical protein GEEBNDBF_02140 [bacterium]|nr:hypothetical protein [bacterium]
MARTTPQSEYRHTCGYCAHEYTLAESATVCGKCGTHQGCRKIVCPRCSYEEAEPPGWLISMTTFLSNLRPVRELARGEQE